MVKCQQAQHNNYSNYHRLFSLIIIQNWYFTLLPGACICINYRTTFVEVRIEINFTFRHNAVSLKYIYTFVESTTFRELISLPLQTTVSLFRLSSNIKTNSREIDIVKQRWSRKSFPWMSNLECRQSTHCHLLCCWWLMVAVVNRGWK